MQARHEIIPQPIQTLSLLGTVTARELATADTAIGCPIAPHSLGSSTIPISTQP